MYKRFRCRIPMNIQLFADGSTGDENGASSGTGGTGDGQQSQGVQIDYDRIQQMLSGTLAAKEDTALKAYFKQQGLSQQEAEQAMAMFKQQKEANTPDVNAMQIQLTQAQEAAQQAKINNAAILQAVEFGIDAKTIPYLLKMADLSQITGQDGKINEESLKNALNKVLEDVPGMKSQARLTSGFRFGTSGQNQQTQSNKDALKKAFGL